MGKLMTYLKYEGLVATVKKVLSKSKKKDSVSIMMTCPTPVPPREKPGVVPEKLTAQRLVDFEKVRFFDHIHGEHFVDNPNGLIILAYIDGAPAGYITAEFGVRKQVHGLGEMALGEKEAWIGPAYVRRQYRGGGLSTWMITTIMNTIAQENGIEMFYTVVNTQNTSSMYTAQKNGFQPKGTVTIGKTRTVCQLEEPVKSRFTPLSH